VYLVNLPTIDDLANHLTVDYNEQGLEQVLMAATDLVESWLNVTFEPLTQVAAPVHTGILMVGAYLYTNKGDCEQSSAVIDSGAYYVIKPYKVEFMV
jgi:hypothetical protein